MPLTVSSTQKRPGVTAVSPIGSIDGNTYAGTSKGKEAGRRDNLSG